MDFFENTIIRTSLIASLNRNYNFWHEFISKHYFYFYKIDFMLNTNICWKAGMSMLNKYQGCRCLTHDSRMDFDKESQFCMLVTPDVSIMFFLLFLLPNLDKIWSQFNKFLCIHAESQLFESVKLFKSFLTYKDVSLIAKRHQFFCFKYWNSNFLS